MIITALSASPEGVFITPKDTGVGKGGSDVKHIHQIWGSVWDTREAANGRWWKGSPATSAGLGALQASSLGARASIQKK